MQAFPPPQPPQKESSPSSSASTGTAGSSGKQAMKKARRTAVTRNACRRCRQAKAKCDGKHPTCTRCMPKHDNCVYDVEGEGVTRMQAMQQKLSAKELELDRLKLVVKSLRDGTDNDAAAILARLRLGDNLDNIPAAVATRLPSGLRDDGNHDSGSTYAAEAAMHNWPSSSVLSRPDSYAFGLQSTLNIPSLTQYFSPAEVVARLANQVPAAQRWASSVAVDPAQNAVSSPPSQRQKG
ncbi:hypothetical protein LTR49_026694 [Elasticomyces elasticus]|nr:hypothetical protein LTR49_026694 [Elasticomyces elasticus]